VFSTYVIDYSGKGALELVGISLDNTEPLETKQNMLLVKLFTMPSEWSYNKRPEEPKGSHLCGGGFEYLHRDPASRGGDEKGSLKSETVKYGHESQGTRTEERLRWRGQ
jgi:hypothetical protein